MMVSKEELLSHAREGMAESIETVINPLLGIRAISKKGVTNPNRATAYFADILDQRGFETTQVTLDDATPNFLIARERDFDPSLPTVLIYGHLDGVDADGPWKIGGLNIGPWKIGGRTLGPWNIGGKRVDPFTVTRHKGQMYGRQIIDNVGPMAANLQAIDLSRQLFGKTCNLIIFTEGGEEIGSPKIDEAIAANRELLLADLGIVTDTGTSNPSKVGLTIGLKGNIVGSTVAQSPEDLCARVANLFDPRPVEKPVQIPGFYEGMSGRNADFDPTFEIAERDVIPKGGIARPPLGKTPLDARAGFPALSTSVLRYAAPRLEGSGTTYRITLKGPDEELHQGLWANSVLEPGTYLAHIITDLRKENSFAIDSLEYGPPDGAKNTIWTSGSAQITGELDNLEEKLLAIAKSYGLTQEQAEYFINVEKVDRNDYRSRFTNSDGENHFENNTTPSATIGIRTVDGQDAHNIIEGARSLLGNYELRDGIALPFNSDISNTLAQHACRSAQFITGEEPSLESCGGSIGAVPHLMNITGSTLLIGFYEEHNCGMHGKNERFAEKLYERHVTTITHLLGTIPPN